MFKGQVPVICKPSKSNMWVYCWGVYLSTLNFFFEFSSKKNFFFESLDLYGTISYSVSLFICRASASKLHMSCDLSNDGSCNATIAGFRIPELVLLLYPAKWSIYLHLDWKSLFNQGPWSSWQNDRADKCNWLPSLFAIFINSKISVSLNSICSQHGNRYQ